MRSKAAALADLDSMRSNIVAVEDLDSTRTTQHCALQCMGDSTRTRRNCITALQCITGLDLNSVTALLHFNAWETRPGIAQLHYALQFHASDSVLQPLSLDLGDCRASTCVLQLVITLQSCHRFTGHRDIAALKIMGISSLCKSWEVLIYRELPLMGSCIVLAVILQVVGPRPRRRFAGCSPPHRRRFAGRRSSSSSSLCRLLVLLIALAAALQAAAATLCLLLLREGRRRGRDHRR